MHAQWSTDPNNNLIVGFGQDPHICSDSAGGCYITYDYNSTSYPRWLALERLDKYGYKPWGINKQILGELPEQWQAEIIEDGEGGVIVSYQDNEWIPPTYFNSKVRVQKVDSSGNFLWGQTGVRVSLETINHSGQNLVSDGDGGCVIAWADWDGEISINRINRLGERVWGDTGIVLASTGTSLRIIRASDGKYYVQVDTDVFRINQNGEIINQYSTTLWNIIPDQDLGVVLGGTVGNISNLRLVTQRKDSLGNNLWQEPYVEIADSLHINSQLSIQYNKGYFYYGWYGKKNGIDKVAQFQALRLDGSKLFQNGSIQVGNPPLNGTIVVPLEQNRTAFIYYNKDFLPDSLFVQTYDTLGNKLWNENGILIAHPPIEYQSYSTDGNGGFIIGGVINNFTVVAQQVSRNGKLGQIVTHSGIIQNELIPKEAMLFQNYPNPFNSQTIIKYEIQNLSSVKISLYNILGERIKILSDKYKSTGTYSLVINSDNLPTGVYIYTLETDNRVLTRKLTILK
jgi:hypothetical protein